MNLTNSNNLGFIFANVFILCMSLFGASDIAKFKVTDFKRCPDFEYRYLTIPRLSIGECAYECKIRPICKSVGYRRLYHLCVVFSTENEMVVNTPDRSPCVFIRGKDIEMDSTVQCNCFDGQVCNRLTGDCEIKECNPHNAINENTNGLIRGNQNEVGAKAELDCKPGWESTNFTATCGIDGNWSNKLECTIAKCPVDNTWVCAEDMPNFKIQVHLERLSHNEAMTECASLDSTLVRIDSERKRDYVTHVLTTCDEFSDQSYWTDGTNTHPKHPGDYRMRFSDGDEMPLGDSHWQQGRPEVYDSAVTCARMQSDTEFLWRDAFCNEPNRFICEQDPG